MDAETVLAAAQHWANLNGIRFVWPPRGSYEHFVARAIADLHNTGRRHLPVQRFKFGRRSR